MDDYEPLGDDLDLDAVICNMPRQPFDFNGERHEWTQSTDNVGVYLRLPPGISRAKQLNILIRRKTIIVSIRGTDTAILLGQLWDEVKPDECQWEIQEHVFLDTAVAMDLVKARRREWGAVLSTDLPPAALMTSDPLPAPLESAARQVERSAAPAPPPPAPRPAAAPQATGGGERDGAAKAVAAAPESKVCNQCHKARPLAEFGKLVGKYEKAGGRRGTCNECRGVDESVRTFVPFAPSNDDDDDDDDEGADGEADADPEEQSLDAELQLKSGQLQEAPRPPLILLYYYVLLYIIIHYYCIIVLYYY